MKSNQKTYLIAAISIVAIIFTYTLYQQNVGQTNAANVSRSIDEEMMEGVDLATSTDPVTPQRLRIPSIGVDAAVESVGEDAAGNMATPKDWRNVSWYEPGFSPGEKGNAVFAGHLDWETNEAVFWDLQNLQPGAMVMVWGEERQLTYIVTQINEYDYRLSDTEKIFGSEEVSQIKLITCDGEFIEGSATYEKRLIVTARLVDTTGR